MKATYLGTVVAGKNQQEAVASFLETINGKHDNKKAVFGMTASREQVFLTSLSSIAKPVSPVTGKQTCAVVMTDKLKIADKFSLFSSSEMLASGKFELVSCTCGNCDSHIVADSTELVAHCIVCGSALDSEDEGEDAVDVRIAPETEEDEQTFLASSADVGFLADLVDILAENGVTTNVELLEALISGDSTNVDADALKQLNDDVVELLGEEAFAEAESEGTIAETLVDTLLGDDEIGASVTTPNYAPPAEGDDENIDDFTNKVPANIQPVEPVYNIEEDDDIDTSVSGDFDDEDSEKNFEVDPEGEDEFDDAAMENLIATALASAHASDADDEEESVDDFAALENSMEVDLLEDTIGASASVASNRVELVYSPSENIGETKWYAVVNKSPVAVATMHSAGQEKSAIFTTDNFRRGTETLMAQMGVAEGLLGMGFQSLKVRVPVRNVVRSHVAQALASTQNDAQSKLDSIETDIRAALATSAVGLNKGFFSETNPLKAAMYSALSSAGLKNAEVLIDNVFAENADDYHRTLLAKSFELLRKPVEARDEISKAIMTASYQRVDSQPQGVALSSTVSNRLATIGRSDAGVMTASAAPAVQKATQLNNRIASVVGGLSR